MDKIKLICFDMDDTLISQNSWYILNTTLGITQEEDQQMYTDYERGRLTYANWVHKILEIYKKRGSVSKKTIESALLKYELKVGTTEIIDYLQNKGYKIALMSPFGRNTPAFRRSL